LFTCIVDNDGREGAGGGIGRSQGDSFYRPRFFDFGFFSILEKKITNYWILFLRNHELFFRFKEKIYFF
jgi:hypothetical protein